MAKGHSSTVTLVHLDVTGFTERDLLTVDPCHHLSECVEFCVHTFKVFKVMHFHLYCTPTISATLSQSSTSGDFPVLD